MSWLAVIGAALAALMPLLAKWLLGQMKSADEAEDARVSKLPDQLKDISDAKSKATDGKDPSALNRIINRD